MFLSRNTKHNVYPYKPQFYYIKVGFKGVKRVVKFSVYLNRHVFIMYCFVKIPFFWKVFLCMLLRV